MSEDREDTETAPLQSEGDAGEPMVEAEADQPTPKKERPRAHAIGEVLEGKRIKKTVERLDFQISIPQEKVKVENGGGDKFGDIPWTNDQLLKMKAAELRPLHIILFERPGKMSTLKRNMRLFNGFTFEVDSQPYIRRREKMLRSFSSTNLKVICNVLALKKGGSKPELIDRILTFLISPRNHGKKSLTTKKRKSKKVLSGSDSKDKTKKKRKTKPKGTSASPKKAKSASKSKAIVMDWTSSDESSSSSDDDDKDEADEKIGVTLDGTDSDSEKKPMEEKDESDSDSEEDEAESPVSKKSTTVKRQRASAKKTGPSKKKAKRELSDESEAGTESEPEEKSVKRQKAVKRQRASAKKTGPSKKKAKRELSDESEAGTESEPEEKPKKKTVDKKATPDSSSNGKKTTSTVTEDSSDDDKPLIKMVKKTPSDEQLKETVQNLLKEVNQEETTMKQICQRVYDTYPDLDLTCRKDFIKQTVKMLIS